MYTPSCSFICCWFPENGYFRVHFYTLKLILCLRDEQSLLTWTSRSFLLRYFETKKPEIWNKIFFISKYFGLWNPEPPKKELSNKIIWYHCARIKLINKELVWTSPKCWSRGSSGGWIKISLFTKLRYLP